MNGRFNLNKAKNHSYLPYNSYLYLFMNEDNAAYGYVYVEKGKYITSYKVYTETGMK